jgi:hypothetical protein
MAREQILKKIDNAANMWEKTKDPRYKALWYQLIREFANRFEKDLRPCNASR